MAINSLSGLGFNSYRIDIPRVNPEAENVSVGRNNVATETSAVNSTAVETSAVNNTAAETLANASDLADKRPRFSNLSDVSLNFNKNDDYSFLGSEADINSLDMKKAISDMKKDKIFEDYQFFVGTSDNVRQMFNSEDGKIIKKG